MESRPPPGAMTYRELLATRVLSVDAFWQELRDPRRRSPREREIPVPLWPGESLQQYEREFGRWLAARRLSLAAMREDPVAERNYRLHFAQTRVARPGGTQRSRSSSRSRSPSRSASPPRRFGGAQQRQQQRPYPVARREDDSRDCTFERRPSPDSGRLFVARRTAERPRPDRSYSRERPQQVRLAAAPEAPRAYDNWQPPRGADPRNRQDPRAPPARDAQRQFVGDVQRWDNSPSRSPQFSRGASPSRSDRSASSRARRSASPQHSFGQARANADNLRKQLLARRVISVDAFRDEMYKLRNGFIREDDLKRPHEAMVRIPVILWPGETMAQYTQKFERWLDSRNIPLASLRDNSARERSLWHSFAYTRAGTSDLGGEPARLGVRSRSPSRVSPRSRSRSRSRSSSRSIRRSTERGRPPMSATYDKPRDLAPRAVSSDRPPRSEHSHSPEQRRRSISPPPSIAPPENPRLFDNKTRRQLLERRIISLDAFQKEVGQSAGSGRASITEGVLPAIPVPLHPGESMGLYDHRFWTWLKDYSETKDSLRGKPARERRFRMAFAYLRTNRTQTPTMTSDHNAGNSNPKVSRPNADVHTKIPLGVLKSARARLAINAKRFADENERQSQASRGEPDTKRARINVEGGRRPSVNPDLPPNRSPYPEQKRSSAFPVVPSNQALPRSSVAPTPIAPSPRVSTPTTTAAALAPVGCVRISTPSQATPAAVFGKVQPMGLTASVQRKQRTLLAKPVPTPVQATKSRSLEAPAQNSEELSRGNPSVLAKSRSLAASAQQVKTMPRTTARVEIVEPARLFADVQSSTSTGSRIAGNPVEIPTSSESRTLFAKATGNPVKPEATPHSVSVSMPWNRSASGPATSTQVRKLAAKPVFSFSLATSAATASRVSTPRPAAPTPSPAPAASSRAPSSANNPTNTTNSTKTSPKRDVANNDSAETDAAVSEPETAPVESAGHANLTAESDEHDGDIMDPDGCCCNKCMRSWAKTLADRMDQLEQNVLDLKGEVVTSSS